MIEANLGYKPEQQDLNGDESKVSPLVIQNAVRSLDRYITRHIERVEDRTLRDRQLTVFEDMRDLLRNGETEGYVKLPTGVGKTVLFTEFIEATRLKTLIVVPTTILVNQTGQRIEEFAEDVDFGKVYGASKRFGRQVTITTYQSLLRNLANGKINPEEYELLVLDEVHQSLTRKRSEAVGKFTNSIKLGFTATPKFSEDKNVQQLLNTEVHSMSIREAVEQDLLCPFSVFIAQSDIDLSSVSITSSGEYNEEDLQKAIDVYNRNQGAVDLYKRLFEGETAVVYCTGVRHAENMAELFRKAGVPTAVISGKNTDREKQEILRQYKDGEIKALCNADILIQGFDEPRASVCLNLRPTLSLVLAEQRGGRVLRKDPNNSQKHAYIVDFFDKIEERKNIPVSFAQVAEGVSITAMKEDGYAKREGGNGREGVTSQTEPEILIPGLKVITNAEEVLRIIREIESKKYQPAPEGWMNINNMRIRLGTSHHGLRRRVEIERGLHPDLFKYYLDSGGRLTEYIAPKLAEKISEEFLRLEPHGEGWMNMNNLRVALGKGDRPIKRLIDPYRISHPQWFKQNITDRGTVREFFSPEIVRLVQTEMPRFQPSPDGWSTYDNLRKTIKRGATNVKKTADRYRDDHPEWFRKFMDKAKKISEFYSPELIERIKKDLEVESEENS